MDAEEWGRVAEERGPSLGVHDRVGRAVKSLRILRPGRLVLRTQRGGWGE